MRELIDAIVHDKLVDIKRLVSERMTTLVREKCDIVKLRLVAEKFDDLNEAPNVTKLGRTKIIRVRVRGGKVQRRKKLSAVPGYTIRGGQLTRMSSTERLNRKMAERKNKYKRRTKIKQSLRRRRMSLKRRQALV